MLLVTLILMKWNLWTKSQLWFSTRNHLMLKKKFRTPKRNMAKISLESSLTLLAKLPLEWLKKP
jgi:hypothetical protein